MGCTWASTVHRTQTPTTSEARRVKDIRADTDHSTAQQLRLELTRLKIANMKEYASDQSRILVAELSQMNRRIFDAPLV